MKGKNQKSVAAIVAHPDDETLWMGGTILNHPSWNWFILCLTRKGDPDRSVKFYNALSVLGAKGDIADLDDGPEQFPLNEELVKTTIMDLMPSNSFDLIITHNPDGEYTRHLRHEETAKAVISLWHSGDLISPELWTFSYEDGGKQYYPRAVRQDSLFTVLSASIWEQKYKIITQIFGFDKDSWEAKTTPREEAFKIYSNPNISGDIRNN